MTNPQTLPILSLITLSHASPTALSALYAVCKDIGFFYLTDHGIPASTLIRLLELSRLFFLHAPAAEKAGLARRNPDRARGYQQIGENITLGRRDAHEAVDLYAPPPRPRGPSVVGEGRASIGEDEEGILSGENLWPSTPVELRAEVEAYVELVKRVGAEVVQAMALALGLKEDLGDGQWDSLVGQVRESFWVMRLIGYPSLEEESEGISCGEHTDYGCVTLLLADSTTGALQVQMKSGEWINADPIPGAFVVNIGDMMERWTNGEWKSTLHRVIHKGSEYRVSVPFFFEPNFDARIKPLKSCVERTGGEPLYGEVMYGDHLIDKIKGNFY